jgi:hypothetical protein
MLAIIAGAQKMQTALDDNAFSDIHINMRWKNSMYNN